MADTLPSSLRAEHLMVYMQAICKGLPRRQSACDGEKKAAEYIRATLERIGLKDVAVQPFKAISTLGLPAILTGFIGLIAFPIGWWGGALGPWLAGLILFFTAYTFFQQLTCRPPLFHRLIERRDSQNVFVTIPPSGEIKRHVYLVGHLDANKQRFIFPPPFPALMKSMQTSVIVFPILAGVSFWPATLLGWNLLWLQVVSVIFLIGLVLLLALDEFQPIIEGANDNATAMSVLLGIGEALHAQPLENAAVTLLFSGCEEVGNHGMLAYLDQHKPPRENSYWIDIEMVGTGNLGYVTHHGVSYLSEYRPSVELCQLAEKTAGEHPELKVSGKAMLMLEEVAPLRRYGYHAICLVGYDRQGYLPNWHRVSDNLENIEPGTLSRAAQFTWALMQTLDKSC